MKYVITYKDPATGVLIYGDIPTSKSHARRWANEHNKEVGPYFDIAPAEEIAL